MIIDPDSMTPTDMYFLLTACVVPRPIAWVTSISPGNIVNAAPFSFFNAVSATPPTIMISIDRRSGEPKDTALNIRTSREFVINSADERVARQMNATSGSYPRVISEIKEAGLSLLPSAKIKAPRIAESPLHMECRLSNWIEVGRGPTDVIFGEILLLHVRDDLYKGGKIDVRELHAIGRLSGSAYCTTREIFEMKRPVIR